MSKKKKEKQILDIYEIERFETYKDPNTGATFSIEGFALRYCDNEKLVLLEDTRLETKFVVDLKEFVDYFEKTEK